MAIFRGVFSFGIFVTNTLFWGALIYLLIPLKLLAPGIRAKSHVTRWMIKLGEAWISVNGFCLDLFHRIDWDVAGIEGLSTAKSYFVVSNHTSWVDIVVLQKIFNRRIPFLRFFLKRQLLYVPVLGGAWWALDFPFMKRHSREFLEKHPEKRGEDSATVRVACERFRGTPISVLNFLEGTRFTPEKRDRQKSAYENLLMPKAGGAAFVLEAMGDQFAQVIDVTIFYPGGPYDFWDLLAGNIKKIVVRVSTLPVPAELVGGSYLNDSQSRENAQKWVANIWSEKNSWLVALRSRNKWR